VVNALTRKSRGRDGDIPPKYG